jgi:hypothetical protein
MKKITGLTVFALGSLIVGGVVASGAEQPINGESTGNVEVHGILGEFDNTTPGPNPPDMTKWINVRIPTTAVFKSSDADITVLDGPEYNITNLSAQGLKVFVSDVENLENTQEITSLSIKPSSGSAIGLIASGAKSLSGATELYSLGSNANTPETGGSNVGQFSLIGTATGLTPGDTEINPKFDLVFGFEAIDVLN